MSLPTIKAVQEFLGGLGDTTDAVAESLRALGARDAPGIASIDGPTVPIGRNCAVAMGLKIRFPDLVDDDDWVVGAFVVRLALDTARARLPDPVLYLVDLMDEERTQLASGEGLTPTWPFLMAEEAS